MEEPRRLGGRYELGSVLGRGGMAEVYLAHDTRLGRTVAVKTLRVDLARDPSFQARFRREAQSAASLNHPSIVAVYDTGEDYVDGVSIPYIVMEYVDGSTLRELLHSGRKLLPERALEMTVGILQALEYSHRAGIVHRDIKPANVMLTRTGQVKVMDFGIARAMGDSGMTMTQTAAVIGTAQYLSPEQAKGEQVDARSDLYSTGCLLYELLTVRPPFVGDSPVAVAYQHVREEPQPPSNFDPEITPEMDAIVLKALVKDPDYRYQSADEMRADIEACLDGQPVAATAAMGAVGYGGYDGYGDGQPTTALRRAGPAGRPRCCRRCSDDDGGYGYDDRPDRRAARRRATPRRSCWSSAGVLVLVGAIFIGKALFSGNGNSGADVTVPEPRRQDPRAKPRARRATSSFKVAEGRPQVLRQRSRRARSASRTRRPAAQIEQERDDHRRAVHGRGAESRCPNVDGQTDGRGRAGPGVTRASRSSARTWSPTRTPGTVVEPGPGGRTPSSPRAPKITLHGRHRRPRRSTSRTSPDRPLDDGRGSSSTDQGFTGRPRTDAGRPTQPADKVITPDARRQRAGQEGLHGRR